MAKTVDVWRQMHTVRLPRPQANEEKMQFVCVNGRSFQIPKGKDVDVPLPVYLALQEAEAQSIAAEAYEQKLLEDAPQ